MIKYNKKCRENIKKIVEEYLEYNGNPTIDEIVDIIRPHYKFTKDELIERELTKKARYIMRTFKDENGVRTYFSDDTGVYINVETTNDLGDLYNINAQLNKKYNGLSSAIKKVTNRFMNLAVKFGGRKIEI